MGFHKYSEVYGRLLNLIPAIRHILPKWTGYDTIYNSNVAFTNFAQQIVDAELAAYAKDDRVGQEAGEHNFIHLYAEQMEIAKDKMIVNPAYHRK